MKQIKVSRQHTKQQRKCRLVIIRWQQIKRLCNEIVRQQVKSISIFFVRRWLEIRHEFVCSAQVFTKPNQNEKQHSKSMQLKQVLYFLENKIDFSVCLFVIRRSGFTFSWSLFISRSKRTSRYQTNHLISSIV